jgi:hypothetical protein
MEVITADKFMSIITPTANASAQSPPLSPSERRRPKRVVNSSSSRGTGADASAAFSSSPSAEIRVPLGALPKGHEEPGATSPSGIPLDQAIGVLTFCVRCTVCLWIMNMKAEFRQSRSLPS